MSVDVTVAQVLGWGVISPGSSLEINKANKMPSGEGDQ